MIMITQGGHEILAGFVGIFLSVPPQKRQKSQNHWGIETDIKTITLCYFCLKICKFSHQLMQQIILGKFSEDSRFQTKQRSDPLRCIEDVFNVCRR